MGGGLEGVKGIVVWERALGQRIIATGFGVVSKLGTLGARVCAAGMGGVGHKRARGGMGSGGAERNLQQVCWRPGLGAGACTWVRLANRCRGLAELWDGWKRYEDTVASLCKAPSLQCVPS